MSLDYPPAELRVLLKQAAEIAAEFYDDVDTRPPFHTWSPSAVRRTFDEPLPRHKADMEHLLKRVAAEVYGAATLNVSPHFFAYVLSGGTHAGIIAELLGAALNQTAAKWHLGASATEIERVVIRWIAEFIGYPADAGGTLVSGGSMANLTALAAARARRAPFDVRVKGAAAGPPLTVYVSAAGHSCLDKAVDMLGLGTEQLRKVPVGEDDTIDLDSLTRILTADRAAGKHPICVVGNGGTVNSGAVDPLDALADLCEREALWFHVDAAYGGPAAATLSAGHLFRGLERADSVALDPHKWLYVPLDVGCILVREAEALTATFGVDAPYLQQPGDGEERFDLMDSTFQLTRSFRALKTWMTFKAYGADALRDAIEDNITVMKYLASLIETARDFELMASPGLSVVCFRYRPAGDEVSEQSLDTLNRELLSRTETDARIFVAGTVVRGRFAVRACCVNHRTKACHVEHLLEVLRELGETAVNTARFALR